MTMMRFRSASASVFGVALLALALSFGPAHAQAQDQKAAPLYNAQGAGGGAVAPLFLNKKQPQAGTGLIGGVLPSRKAYGMNSATVATSPQNVQKAAKQFEENRARQIALNKQIRDSRLADIRAQFDATRAREEAADAQRMQQKALQRKASTQVGPTGKLPEAATAPAPYAGSNVVFTGRKKDGEQKPVRLFNMR